MGVGRGAGEGGAGFREFVADLLHFGVDGDGLAVGADEGAVVLLLAVEGGAPLPVLDGVGAVADGLPGHGADLALVEGVLIGRQLTKPGCGLHDPEVFALVAADKVVARRRCRPGRSWPLPM